MKLLKIFFILFCIEQAFLLSPVPPDDLIVEEVDQDQNYQKNKEKHKILDDEQDQEKDNQEQIGLFITEFLTKYDPEKTGKISLEDYQQFLEDLYVNSFEYSSEEDNEAMRQLIIQFIQEEKKTDFVSYEEIKEDVNGPGFTNFFEKKLQENMKKQDEYLQDLIDNAGAELVEEKLVDNQEDLEKIEKNIKPDL